MRWVRSGFVLGLVSLGSLASCSGGSSSDDGIKTPGDNCAEESARGDAWCAGDKNACVDETCRFPCSQAGDCTVLLSHQCCEVDSTAAAMVCLPEAKVGTATCLPL